MNSPIYFKENEFLIERSVRLNNGALISRGGAYAQIVNINELGGDQNPTNALAGYYIVLPLDFPDVEGKKTVLVNPPPLTASSAPKNSIPELLPSMALTSRKSRWRQNIPLVTWQVSPLATR